MALTTCPACGSYVVGQKVRDYDVDDGWLSVCPGCAAAFGRGDVPVGRVELVEGYFTLRR